MGCLRISAEDKQDTGVKDGYLKQTQEYWGMLHSEDLQLDLKSLMTKVQQPRSSQAQIPIGADAVQMQALKRIKVNDAEIIATPWPKMERIARLLIGTCSAESVGLAPESRAGSAVISRSMVTIRSV